VSITRHAQGQKPLPRATLLVKTLLPHKADEQLSAVSHHPEQSRRDCRRIGWQPRNRDTRLGHTLFTLSKNEPAMQTHCRQTVLPRSS
jgi:hypothetical protein